MNRIEVFLWNGPEMIDSFFVFADLVAFAGGVVNIAKAQDIDWDESISSNGATIRWICEDGYERCVTLIPEPAEGMGHTDAMVNVQTFIAANK